MAKRDIADLILYNDEGEILLQHRADDAPRLPGYWGLFGGGMEEGESPLEALARELKEELNYVTQNPAPLTEQPFEIADAEGDSWNGVWHTFLEKFDSSQPLIQGEGKSLGWFKPSETSDLRMTDDLRKIIKMVVEKI